MAGVVCDVEVVDSIGNVLESVVGAGRAGGGMAFASSSSRLRLRWEWASSVT